MLEELRSVLLLGNKIYSPTGYVKLLFLCDMTVKCDYIFLTNGKKDTTDGKTLVFIIYLGKKKALHFPHLTLAPYEK